MIFAILTAILAYRRANEAGRSGALWAVLGIVAFIGSQLAFGLAIGVIMASGIAVFGWSESIFDRSEWPLNILGIVVAFAASYIVIHFAGRVPPEAPMVLQPPPPPTFPGAPSDSDESQRT